MQLTVEVIVTAAGVEVTVGPATVLTIWFHASQSMLVCV